MIESGASRPLPSAPTVAAYLKSHRPRGSSRSIAFTAVALLCILAAATVSEPSGLSGLIPWVLLLILLGWSMRRGRRMQAIHRETMNVYELTLTHHWRESVDAAWQLLPKVTENQQAHAQTASLLASSLAQLRAHEAAIAAHEHLLRYLPPDNTAGRFIRLQRLRSLLHVDRLTDANDELAKLSRADLSPVEAAHLALAQLHQRVRTNHLSDIASEEHRHLDALRPLGTEAAQGYALIATAMRASGRHKDAERWWHRATMLMTPASIAWSLPETAVLMDLPRAPTLGGIDAGVGGVR